MWSGFSSEIETHHLHIIPHDVVVACGAASRLRLKRLSILSCGLSGEVACGAASRLRLKPSCSARGSCYRKVACGAASRLRLKLVYHLLDALCQGMSHVERLLV